jgi:hypothetical protein
VRATHQSFAARSVERAGYGSSVCLIVQPVLFAFNAQCLKNEHWFVACGRLKGLISRNL